ncbi:TetR/AcrR family transcriptional regulator [Pendulispora rubella]|uniref:TetR/AcrR family transcriptional regulator n=1 Tax=Pendulispora rubella TaxID=2741070 RepID=A0ABZ2KWP6_9BACT
MARIAKKSGTYHHGDLRRALVDAAVRVVDKEGVEALSLVAIAKKAGVSSGAPYHHFQNREELLAAIATDGFGLLAASMKEDAESTVPRPGEKTGEARLRGIGRGYVRFALQHPGYFRIMFRPEVKSTIDRADVNEAFALLTDAIALAQTEGALPPGDPRPLILLAWSTVHGASVLWLDGPLESEGLVDNADSLAATVADTLMLLLRKC